MFDLTNKTILVAGGAGYLGSKLCEAILLHNGNICIADINLEKINSLRDSLTQKFPDNKIFSTMLDIKNENSIIECVNKTNKYFDNINGLVNATYGSTGKALNELTAKEFNDANEINLTGSFLLSRHAISTMREGGSVIMFASMYGIVSPKPNLYPEGINPNPIEYGAGKAGLIQLTKYLASHYGSKNIRVNAVAPGAILLPSDGSSQESELINEIPLNRIGKEKDISEAVIGLTKFSYVTGQILKIDGGRSLN